GLVAATVHVSKTTDGGWRDGKGVLPDRDRVTRGVAGGVRQFHFGRVWLLYAARLYPGLCHRACAIGAGFCDGRTLVFLLPWSGCRPRSLWPRPFQRHRDHSGAAHRSGPADGDRLDLRPTIASAAVSDLAAAAVRRDTLIGHPDILRQFSSLPENVDRYSAARIPIATDAQPLRFKELRELLADGDGAIFVKSAVVAKAIEIELERL